MPQLRAAGEAVGQPGLAHRVEQLVDPRPPEVGADDEHRLADLGQQGRQVGGGGGLALAGARRGDEHDLAVVVGVLGGADLAGRVVAVLSWSGRSDMAAL